MKMEPEHPWVTRLLNFILLVVLAVAQPPHQLLYLAYTHIYIDIHSYMYIYICIFVCNFYTCKECFFPLLFLDMLLFWKVYCAHAKYGQAQSWLECRSKPAKT